jgi:hypothetical protein
MPRTSAVLLGIAATLSTAPALAGPAVDAAERAETLILEGRPVEALDALRQAEKALWEWMPLSFRTAKLVHASDGAGANEESANAAFQPDEEMVVHVEPIGFGYSGSGEAATVDFSIDLAIANAAGQVVIASERLIQVSFEAPPEQDELALTLKLVAPYIRPGDYTAIFTVSDENSGKSASFELPFELGPPASAAESAPQQ